MNKKILVALTALALIAGFVFGARAFQQQRTETTSTLANEQSETLVPAHAMTLGSPDAKVVIVEFFDPACETCSTFYKPVKSLLSTHPGKIRLVMRYAPFHQGSDLVVQMLESARGQDKYWETLEVMYASQPYWASHHNPQPELLWQILPQAGIDVGPMKQVVGGGSLAALVARDVADAETLGVRKTPSFFVNGRPLTTFGWDPLVALVEAELATQYPEG